MHFTALTTPVHHLEMQTGMLKLSDAKSLNSISIIAEHTGNAPTLHGSTRATTRATTRCSCTQPAGGAALIVPPPPPPGLEGRGFAWTSLQ